MTKLTTSRVVAGIAAGTLVLAGCNGESRANGTPSAPPASSTSTSGTTTTATTSPVVTASPTSSVTVSVPAAAREHTEAGAQAFAEFYYNVASEAAYRADSGSLRQLSAPGCGGCDVHIELADRLRANGQHVDRRSLVVHDTALRPATNSSTFVVDVMAEDKPSNIVAADGTVVSREPGAKLTFRTTVGWQSGHWLVLESKLVLS